jgi:serine O-acetyltransferase
MPNSVNFYRVARWFYVRRINFIAIIIEAIIFVLYNCRIPSSCKIGQGTIWGYGGIGVVIHARAEIGDNVIIGANAVVIHNVESNTVVAGIPAKVIKMTK